MSGGKGNSSGGEGYESRRETDCRRGIGTHIWRRRGTHN